MSQDSVSLAFMHLRSFDDTTELTRQRCCPHRCKSHWHLHQSCCTCKVCTAAVPPLMSIAVLAHADSSTQQVMKEKKETGCVSTHNVLVQPISHNLQDRPLVVYKPMAVVWMLIVCHHKFSASHSRVSRRAPQGLKVTRSDWQ